MSKVKIKLNTKAIGNILKSEEMKQYVESVANQQKDSDSHIKTFVGFDRAKSFIYPNTKRHPG